MTEVRTRHWILVVVAAVALVTPWPILGAKQASAGKWYILAVPVYEYAMVAPSILGAPQFAIIDVKTNTTTVVPNPYAKLENKAGPKCAHLLADRDVGVLIAKSVDQDAYAALTRRGIAIYAGSPATADEAVYQLRNGMMQRAKGPVRAGQPGTVLPPVLPAPRQAPAPIVAASPRAPLPAASPPAQHVELVSGPFQLPRLGMEVFGAGQRVTVYRTYVWSRAERAGLQSGDRIVAFAGRPVTDLAAFMQAVSRAPEEQVVSLEMVREQKRLLITVTMGEGEMESVILPTNPAPQAWSRGIPVQP